MLRRFLLAALLVPALMVSSAFAAEKITVASDPTWPPMEFLDDNKQVVGYDVDMIKAVAKEAGMEAEVRMVAWDGIFAGVAAGNYDVVASGVTITPRTSACLPLYQALLRCAADRASAQGPDCRFFRRPQG